MKLIRLMVNISSAIFYFLFDISLLGIDSKMLDFSSSSTESQQNLKELGCKISEFKFESVKKCDYLLSIDPTIVKDFVNEISTEISELNKKCLKNSKELEVIFESI